MNIQAKRARLVIGLILSPTLFFALAAAPHQDYTPPHDQPGPATDTINFSAFDVGIASKELEAGAMDMYIFSLKTPAAEALESNPDVTVYQAPASTISIVLNPAPAPEGELNPLSIKEVRQALQYVVNRPFIAQELYKGFALPMLTHVSPVDFDFLTVFNLTKESRIAYDPDLAKDLVDQAMTQAGAEMKDGFWHFGDNRLDLKFIVRTEDERWDIGNDLRSNLGLLGFSVTLVPQQFGPAIFTVYGTDPQLFQWHLYTEGWGRGAPQRYDFGNINQMCAPWLGNLPGWQEVGFWQYEAPELDALGQRIFTGDFKGLEERNQLYVETTEACLEESVRLWVVTAVNNIPAVSNIQGITEDLISGPKSVWTLREAYVPGNTEELNVGNLWVWTNRTTWNPVGGFSDVYSNDIWRNVRDTPLATHPFTGIPIPFRADYQVETAGSGNKMDLPSDAFLWNAGTGSWSTVPVGTRATSKVTFDYSKYFQSKWHHDQPITMADVLYPISQLFDMVYNEEKANIEISISTTSRPLTDTFKGFRITEDNKLEVYVDFWHFVDDYIAQYASISGVTMPWEVMAAMDDLVFQQRTATYSDTAAARFSLDPISLVLDRFARLTRNTLRGFAETTDIPEGVFTIDGGSLVSKMDAAARYTSAIDWFERKGHMVISNGPYLLETFDSSAQFAQIKAFRDPDYPFQPGDLYYGKPQAIRIVGVEGASLQEGADLKTVVELEGPGNMSVQYVFQEPATGEIISSGLAEALSDNRFQVHIPADVATSLTGDLYHLFLAAYTDELSTLLERRVDVEFGTGAPDAQPTTQPSATTTAAPTDTRSEDNDGSPAGLIIGIILVAAAGIGTGLMGVMLRSRRRPA
ncbi:MAG: ABC transporter substrate-binding protein [Dehalococcoidia bacterium]|nr:ABC transporter substrate-binding protein [Dehalococcoidia bacterium]